MLAFGSVFFLKTRKQLKHTSSLKACKPRLLYGGWGGATSVRAGDHSCTHAHAHTHAHMHAHTHVHTHGESAASTALLCRNGHLAFAQGGVATDVDTTLGTNPWTPSLCPSQVCAQGWLGEPARRPLSTMLQQAFSPASTAPEGSLGCLRCCVLAPFPVLLRVYPLFSEWPS